jgi:hypothetical protein
MVYCGFIRSLTNFNGLSLFTTHTPPEGGKINMAKPIKPTPILRGKAAERFIRKLEAEKNIPVYPSAKETDMEALRAIVAEIEQRKQQKFN